MSSGNGRRSGRNGLEVRYGTTKASVKKKKKEEEKKRKGKKDTASLPSPVRAVAM